MATHDTCPQVSVLTLSTAPATRRHASRARPAASAAAARSALCGPSPRSPALAARVFSRTWQLWLVTVFAAATWCSDVTLIAGDQAARSAALQASWRTRSAPATAPSHRAATGSPPCGRRRGGSEFTGIACSRSRSAADTGSRCRAASTDAFSTRSHWQAAFNLRRQK